MARKRANQRCIRRWLTYFKPLIEYQTLIAISMINFIEHLKQDLLDKYEME